MNTHSLTAAGRLWNFLTHCSVMQGNKSSLDVWASYFKLESTFSEELFEAVAMMVKQPRLFEEDVASIEDPIVPAAVLLAELPKIRAALETAAYLSNPIESMQRQYDAGTLRSLETASHVISRAQFGVREVPVESIDNLRVIADELLAAVNSATDIDSELRGFLYRHASAILRGIDLYRIGGIDEVFGRVDQLTGAMLRSPEMLSGIARSTTVKSQLKKLFAAVTLIAAVIHTPIAIAADIQTLLELTVGASESETVAPVEQNPETGIEI